MYVCAARQAFLDSSGCIVLQPRLVNVGQSSRASRLTLTIHVQKHHFSDSQTVALFVHRCMRVVDEDLQAQRA
jgi:hypothetical protein